MNYNHNNPNELYHYGVLGMKWGVRRGRADKAYAKASKKLAKYDEKTQKYDAKVNKSVRRLAANRYPDSESSIRAKKRINKYTSKSLKQMRKAEKWYKKMEKAFSETDINLSQEQIAIGKKYADAMAERQRNIMINRVYR